MIAGQDLAVKGVSKFKVDMIDLHNFSGIQHDVQIADS